MATVSAENKLGYEIDTILEEFQENADHLIAKMDMFRREFIQKATLTSIIPLLGSKPTQIERKDPEKGPEEKDIDFIDGDIDSENSVLIGENIEIGYVPERLTDFEDRGIFIFYSPPNHSYGFEFRFPENYSGKADIFREGQLLLESDRYYSDSDSKEDVEYWWSSKVDQKGGIGELMEAMDAVAFKSINEFACLDEDALINWDEDHEDVVIESSESYPSIVSFLHGEKPAMDEELGWITGDKFDIHVDYGANRAYVQLHDEYSRDDLMSDAKNNQMNKIERLMVSNGMEQSYFEDRELSGDERKLFTLYSSDMDYEIEEK